MFTVIHARNLSLEDHLTRIYRRKRMRYGGWTKINDSVSILREDRTRVGAEGGLEVLK